MSKQEKQDNVLMIIQVPLKQKREYPLTIFDGFGESMWDPYCENIEDCKAESMPSVNVEPAIIKVGESEGKFTEVGDLEIERDTRFPVRLTFQFYKSTDNGLVNKEVMQEIADLIEGSRKSADYFGSLVTEVNTGRPTDVVDR
jgi:hypothetical protein